MAVNNNRSGIMPVMPEQRAEFFEDLGINVTNPTTGDQVLGEQSLPNMPHVTGINIHEGMRSGYSDLGQDQLNAMRTVRNQFYRSSEQFERGIARRVQAPTYGGRPQETAQNVLEFAQQDNPRMAVFDIETLPVDPTQSAQEVSPNTQIPVEMEFHFGQFGESGWERQGTENILIQPQQQHRDVLDKVRRQLDRGTGVRLSEGETQTLRRLAQYGYRSDASDFTPEDFRRIIGEGDLVRQLDEDALDMAEAGHRYLREEGLRPEQAADRVRDTIRNIGDDTFLGGHNIANFDMPLMDDFLSNHLDDAFQMSEHSYIDTLRVAQDIGGGNLGRTLGEEALASRVTGHRLEDLVDAFDISPEQIRAGVPDEVLAGGAGFHDAPFDVSGSAEVIDRMFNESDRMLNMQSDINRQMDLAPIKEGDLLFTTRGGRMYGGGEGFEGAFEQGLIGFKENQRGQLVQERTFLESQAPFEFQGIRQTEDRTVAMMRNLATEEDVFIGHEDPNELINYIQERARHADDMFPGAGREEAIDRMMDFRDYKMRDISRSRWRQVMTGRDTDSYDKLRRMLTAYEQEENVLHNLRRNLTDVDQVGAARADRILEAARQGQINKMEDLRTIRGIGDKVFENVQRQQQSRGLFNELFEFQDRLETEIFAFERGGEQVQMGRWPEHYRRMRGRIEAEYEPLRTIADRIGQQDQYDMQSFIQDYGGDDFTQSDEFWRIKRERHAATAHALQRYRDQAGEMTELARMPEYKRHGIDLRTPIPGGDRHVTLDPTRTGEVAKHVNLQAQRARDFEDITGTAIDPNQTVRRMFDASSEQIRSQYQLQARMRQLRRGTFDDPEDAARRLRTAFDRHRQVIPDRFGVEDRIQQLRDSPGTYEEHMRDFRRTVSQEQGLDGDVMRKISPQQAEEFASEIEELGERVGRGEIQTGVAARRFEETLRQYTVRQDDSPFWAFGREYREVEQLSPDTGELRGGTETARRLADDAVEQMQDVYHAPMGSENIFRSSFDNQLLDRVDYLDKNLRQVHQQLNFDRTPPTMRETLAQFTDELERGLSDDVSYSMIFRGSEQDPRITTALYSTNRADTVMSMTPQEIMDEDTITTFDIPLISEDQYMNVGGRQRVAPPGILDLDPALREGVRDRGDVVIDNIDEQLRMRNPLDAVLGDAFDIDARLAQGSQDRATASWVISRLDEQVRQGYHRDAEQFVRKRFNTAAERMAGSMGASFGEDPTALYSGFRADMTRKRSLIARRVFEDMGGTWHDLEGEALYPGQGLSDFLAGTGDYRGEGMADVIRDFVGDDANIAMGATRSKHWTQGIVSMADTRDLAPFSYYTNPARPNILQRNNVRPMTQDVIEGYRDQDAISLSPGVVTEPDYAIRGTGDFAQAGVATDRQVSGVRVPTVTADPSDIYGGTPRGREGMSLIEAIQESPIDGERKTQLIEDIGRSPAMWEDQIILAESAAYPTGDPEDLIAQRPRRKTYEGVLNYDEGIIGQSLDYDQSIGRWEGSGEEFTPGYRATRRVDDIQVDREAGETVIDFTEEYKMRPGMTKAMMGTEKGTVRTVVPDEVMEMWMGEDVRAAIGSGYRSHAAFGDIMEGYTAQAVRRINDANIENTRQKIEQLGEVINENFMKADADFQYSVERSHVNAEKFELVFSQDNLPDEIQAGQIRGMLEGMDEVVPGGLDEGVLDIEMRLAMQDENLHFLSLDEQLGRKGAKFTAAEVEKLDASGFRETADWLRGQIGRYNQVTPELMERGLAYDYMMRDAMDDPSAIGGAIPEDTARFADEMGYGYYTAADISEDFRELGRSPLETARQSPYTYRKGALAGTALDPETRGAAFVELPEPVQINIDDMTRSGRQAGDGTYREIDRVFMPQPDPRVIDQGDELEIAGDLGRRQTDIMENVQRYREAQQGLIDADVADVHQDLQRSVRRYYEEVGSDLMESKGAIQENVMSARLPGSGRAKLQITSPALEVAAMDDAELEQIQRQVMGDMDDNMARRIRENDVNLRNVKQNVLENIEGTGLEPIDDPATAYISEKRAHDMLQGHENRDEIIRRMKGQADGAAGQPVLMHRDPVIHPTSTMPVNMRISEGLDDDAIRMPSTLAEAYFGDADGDSVSFAMVGQTDVEDFRRDIERTRELITAGGEQIGDHPFAGTRTGVAQRNVVGSMLEEMAEGTPADILEEESMIRKMDVDTVGGSQFADNLARAKIGRQVYTGTLTNLADQYRKVGRNVLQDDQQMQAFRSAVGSLIEEPISSKHWMTGTAKGTAGFDPRQAYDVLQDVAQGGDPARIGQELGEQGAGILQPAEVDALTQVARTAPDELGKTGNQIWQSTRALRQNQEEIWRSVYGRAGKTPTEEWGTFANQYWDTMMEQTPYEGTDMSEHLRQRAEELTERGRRAREAQAQSGAKVTAKLGGQMDEAVRRTPFGAKGTAALALGAGVFAGQMSTADNALPMDEMDDPGLNPVPDTADRGTNLQIGEQQAMDIMAERTDRMRINADRTRGANSINEMDLSQHGDMGYEIAVQGDTTIGRSPEELGAVVERAIHETTEVPLDISVNTNDNRQGITREWLEERMAGVI